MVLEVRLIRKDKRVMFVWGHKRFLRCWQSSSSSTGCFVGIFFFFYSQICSFGCVHFCVRNQRSYENVLFRFSTENHTVKHVINWLPLDFLQHSLRPHSSWAATSQCIHSGVQEPVHFYPTKNSWSGHYLLWGFPAAHPRLPQNYLAIWDSHNLILDFFLSFFCLKSQAYIMTYGISLLILFFSLWFII